MKHYTTLQPNRKRNTSPLPRQSGKQGKPSRNIGKTILVWAIVLSMVLPVWRSGLKGNLTFLAWVKNHTIWGDPVEFIPREDYERIFSEE